MELLISKQNQSISIKKGKYGVAEDIEGFLNDFDGVFGFANVGSIGEEPFFAKKGSVVITQLTELGLRGNINITFKCNNELKFSLMEVLVPPRKEDKYHASC